MSDFDPYHKWLGISPQHQPPNHYRLLSLDLYESDPDVIEASVDRIASFLQDVAAGPQAKESQKLLNEIAAARLCLLAESQKSAYDEVLKAELAQAIWPPEDEGERTPPPPVAPAFAIDTNASTTAKPPPARKANPKRPTVAASPKRSSSAPAAKKPKQQKQQASPLLLLSFASGGVLLICAIAFAMFGSDSEAKRRAAEEARVRERQESFAEMGRQAESMIPDFEANFESNTAAPASSRPKKKRKKNKK
ncbi:MAG: hypothetical protein H8E66_22080 [Planctomycetes bacterium]|nr:hypothetical protein [Planctomycetota bacterium]